VWYPYPELIMLACAIMLIAAYFVGRWRGVGDEWGPF
jgi:hypothetical protein